MPSEPFISDRKIALHGKNVFFPIARNAISVWTPKFAPCFRIIREKGKYKRLRNADKFQARVSKIPKALAETSTRPVTFHEQVCLGEDDVVVRRASNSNRFTLLPTVCRSLG